MRFFKVLFLVFIILTVGCTEKKVVCPMCGGRGVVTAQTGGVFAPQFPCTACDQTGQVSASSAKQLILGMNKMNGMFGGAGNNYSGAYNHDYNGGNSDNYGGGSGNNGNGTQSSTTLCAACNGSGRCPICRYGNAQQYGDIQYCKSCGNTHKCSWCSGTGFQ